MGLCNDLWYTGWAVRKHAGLDETSCWVAPAAVALVHRSCGEKREEEGGSEELLC
jgi:hypothetical protein